MTQNWFIILYWGLILTVGGGSIHMAATKMRKLAMEAVARPWPSLKMELKQTTDHDPFIVVKKNGRTYLLHEDRIKKRK
jgi:hypothetical protein